MKKNHVLALAGVCLVVILVAGAFVSAGATSPGMVQPATVLSPHFSEVDSVVATPISALATAPDIAAYDGLGSWLDIFEKAYQHPAPTVSAMQDRGVVTIYVETSNYSRPDIQYPTKLGQVIDEAHAAGMKVVGWYLPSFVNLKKDLRKSRAALEFTSPLGDHLDSFGLDIESGIVQNAKLRTERLLKLSDDIRTLAGPSYPLGAITPIPNRLVERHTYWPHFPYRKLSHIYDVFVPMNYFSFDVSGETAARKYTAKGIRLIRTGTGNPDEPIHEIGGIASAMSAAETRGFLDAVHAGHAVGASLYNFTETGDANWNVMQGL